MSGGHFEYNQYRLEDIADSIEREIETNDSNEPNEWGGGVRGNHYPPEVIARFRTAVATIRKAEKMATRVDWLLSGDDGEENFVERWKEEGLDDEQA